MNRKEIMPLSAPSSISCIYPHPLRIPGIDALNQTNIGTNGTHQRALPKGTLRYLWCYASKVSTRLVQSTDYFTLGTLPNLP